LTSAVAEPGRLALYEERCRQALDVALGLTPMYAAWRDRDPGPARPLDERYRALPILTKDDIRAHFPYGLVPRGSDLDAARARGEVSYVRTSGTAHEALDNIWNQRWWDQSERASWALNTVAARAATGEHREAILASALSVGPRSAGAPLDRAARSLGRFLFLNEYGRTEEWPEGHEKRIASEITDYRPAVLEANPSLLARVSRWIARAGAGTWQPDLIVLTYEFASELHLRAIHGAFHSPVASSYGSTEAGYVFMECERGRLHQNAETCRIDLAPLPGAQEVPPGGLGLILATTFANEWFPLLRFEVGDVGRLASAPCPCGRGFGITLAGVEGRIASMCVAGDGTLLTHRKIDLALAGVDGLQQYRVDQDVPVTVRCAVIAEPARGSRATRGAEEALSALFGPGVHVEAAEVQRLVPEASGKFLLVRRGFALEEAAHV